MIRGALTGDMISVAHGAAKALSPKVIAIILTLFIFIILLPVTILSALPQVLFCWSDVDDAELKQQKAYADHLVACYESAEDYKRGEIQDVINGLEDNGGAIGNVDDIETDILWLIAIDSVRHKQNLSTMNAAEIQSSIRRSLDNTDNDGNVTSVSIKNKDPEKIMDELGFTEDEKNWARLMYSTMTYGQYLDTEGDYAATDIITDYSGIKLREDSTEVTYYNQLDDRWKNKLYGKTGTIGQEGCGPTAVAIVASTFSGKNITPVDVAKWSVDNGHRCVGSGSYHSLIPEASKHYGLTVKGLGSSNATQLAKSLSSGKLIIALMKKGHFTSSGHIIVLRGITSENKILVADPASYKRSGQEWDVSIILNECSKGAGADGPFWEISLN